MALGSPGSLHPEGGLGAHRAAGRALMRVLLIDDHALVRNGIGELLQSRGVQVVASVSSGDEGVHRASELHPDIILLDVKMPGMSGIETVLRLRASGSAVPALMLTMSHEDEDLRAALRAGAQGYLLKDMEPEDLLPPLDPPPPPQTLPPAHTPPPPPPHR